MSEIREIAVAVLLFAGVAVELIGCVGLLTFKGAYNRLHYLAPASVTGPVLIGLAVVLRHPISLTAAKAVLIVSCMALVSPILTHSTARSTHLRETGERDQKGNGSDREGSRK